MATFVTHASCSSKRGRSCFTVPEDEMISGSLNANCSKRVSQASAVTFLPPKSFFDKKGCYMQEPSRRYYGMSGKYEWWTGCSAKMQKCIYTNLYELVQKSSRLVLQTNRTAFEYTAERCCCCSCYTYF